MALAGTFICTLLPVGEIAPEGVNHSVMTNATVGTVSEAPQGKMVHVKFKDGESEYSIGPDVPILAPVPGDKSLLKPGVAVFLAGPKEADGTVAATFMYIEKDGIKPPM